MRDEEKGGEELPANTTTTPTVDDDPQYIVKWADGDPENPYNWGTLYKSWVTLQLSMLALSASATSSMIAPANRIVAAYVGVSETVAVLNVSLFVYVHLSIILKEWYTKISRIGFCVGPLLWVCSRITASSEVANSHRDLSAKYLGEGCRCCPPW